MNELNFQFKNYIEEFKKLDIDLKRNEFIKSFKEFISILEVIATNEGINVNFIKSNEVLDLQKNSFSEDDFIEASVVYLENVKNIVGEILEKKL